jgi:hypothetical protein
VSFITEEERARLMGMSRKALIDYICASGYITALPAEKQGVYLFGHTKDERAICLIGRETNHGCINRAILLEAYREIARAGLKVPFLFFGFTSVILRDDAFTFAQLPWCFERRSNPILRILQGMNMRANLRIPVLQASGGAAE